MRDRHIVLGQKRGRAEKQRQLFEDQPLLALEAKRVDVDRCVELFDAVPLGPLSAHDFLGERTLARARARRFGWHVHAARSAPRRTAMQAQSLTPCSPARMLRKHGREAGRAFYGDDCRS
jgi:hypothetical protein